MNNLKTAAFGNKRGPRQTLIDALDKSDDAEMVVVVWKDREGYIKTGWSDGHMTERVGLCEIAKQQMIDACREDEE